MANGGAITARHMLLMICASIGSLDCSSYQDVESLYKNLTGKNNNIRPVLDQSQPVHVHVLFQFVFIQEFDEVDGKFSISGIFAINWHDETVAWNASENNIYSLTYHDTEFWKPALLIGNSYGGAKYIFQDDSVKRVTATGHMEWTPADTFDVICEADVSKYPFDTHQCYMTLLAWGYTSSEVDLHHSDNNVNTDYYSRHKTWDLTSTSVYKQDTHPQMLVFAFQLKRQPTFFVLNFIVPIAVMCFLNVFVFLIPANSGERVGFSITVLLAIAVFLTISLDSLPATSYQRIPTISLLLISYLIISSLIIILVVLGLKFHHHKDQTRVSNSARHFVRSVRCLRRQHGNGNNDRLKDDFQHVTSVDHILSCGKNDNLASVSDVSSDIDNISWSDVGETFDFISGILITFLIITIHVLFIIDIKIGLPWNCYVC